MSGEAENQLIIYLLFNETSECFMISPVFGMFGIKFVIGNSS